MSSKSIRILVIGPAWVGDFMMAQVLFKCLKAQNPGAIIDVIAPLWSAPLSDKMPEIRRSIPMPIGHGRLALKQRYQLAKSLIKEEYTHAYVLPNSFKSALIPFWAKIPHRIGWRGEMRWGLLSDCRKLDKQRYPRMIDRFAALAFDKNAALPAVLPLPSLEIDLSSLEQSMSALKISKEADKKIIAFCPGAEFGPSKQWKFYQWEALGRACVAQGMDVWVLGSEKDRPFAESIAQSIGERCTVLAGQTSLPQAIDCLGAADAVVTNDSGLMHIAASLAKPVVAIYGSTSPQFTPPLGQRVTILQATLPCQPCFKRECPLKHGRCMDEVTPTQVLSSLMGHLSCVY